MGGHGRRFGRRDKSALVVAGRSIRDRQLETLGGLTDDIMLVGAREAVGARGRRVPDRVPDSGPLGGLDAALASARVEELLLLACDMPFVTAPFLEYLLALSAERDVVIPQTERGYHPLCAVSTRRCHAAVMRRLAEHRLALLGLLDDVQVRVVTKGEIERFGSAERLLANVNTPDEFRDLEALLGHEL
jgi:molybdopterin-guanine dinucleotide biosynthesis protein A